MSVTAKARGQIAHRIWILLCIGVLLNACRGVPKSDYATLRAQTLTVTSLEQATPSVAQSLTLKTPEATITPTLRATQTPTHKARPTATPTPIASPSPTLIPEPRILSFEITPQAVDPGDTITLTWTSENGTRATLYRLLQSGQFPEQGMDVPPTGSITYTIDLQARNWVDFLLYVWGQNQSSDQTGASVTLRCPQDWFFSPPPEVNVCPTVPQTSPAAEQSFERGVMLWIEAEDSIYVLFADEGYTTRWTRFQDDWQEGDPDRDPTLQPPSGLQQPIRGFGWVWRTYPYVRERLGWATESEKSYQTTIQRTTRYTDPVMNN